MSAAPGIPPAGSSAGPAGRAGVRIEARGWGWRHATRKAWAVRGLDLVIEPGERVLLLGQSGAGKSTLLAGIAGLLDPENSGDEEGELLLDGVPARQARLDGVRAGRARTGLLLQDPNAQTVLARCGDDVAFGCENHGLPTAQIWPRVDRALASVGFGYDRMHSTAALSGGERQRLALAGLLALQPDLLLLDEPTAMLDPGGAALVRDAVARVLAGAGCLLVEHRVEPWLPLVERVLVLAAGGGLLADGRPSDVFAGHGTALADDGVWVPGLAARLTDQLAGRAGGIERYEGAKLLVAEGLAAARPGSPLSRRSLRVPVVRDVDLEVRAGRAICLTGPNGAGKSTLAVTLAGLVAPAGGRLYATPRLLAGPDGSDPGLPPEPVRWPARALVSRLGTVFQDPRHQFVARTVRDELLVGPRQAGREVPDQGRRVDLLLERLRLQHLAGANPFTLSGGEQRRLSVATVLAAAPSVLVLDEPTFGQDARTWAELAALLLELLDQGCALVCATHDRELVRVLAAAGAELALDGGAVAA